jgi:hypothetical protein
MNKEVSMADLKSIRNRARVILTLGLSIGHATIGIAAERLQGFATDIAQTSVSGISSGAYLAVQFHVAHSNIVRGAGIIAGGPYYCAENSSSRA